MKWRNVSTRLVVSHRLAGGDPNIERIGIPVRIYPGEEVDFMPGQPSWVALMVRGGVLEPADAEARKALKSEG